MAYFLNLFSPETHAQFTNSDQTVSGFRASQFSTAERIKPGDIFVCYLTRISRWCGLFEVVEGPYRDNSPIYVKSGEDPYEVRFRVKPIVWLTPETSIPIHQSSLWDSLSFTRGLPKNSSAWTGKFRSSLNVLDDDDARILVDHLTSQASDPKAYPFNERDERNLARLVVRGAEKDVPVYVPDDGDVPEMPEMAESESSEARESIRVQATLAKIGISMGLRVWIPRGDKARVQKELDEKQHQLLDRLPLNYDDITLRTIEQIDVIWLKGRSIVRAFEVEHTTAVYSGILRMADLMALQPNMAIKLHIVAPAHRREKVMQQIQRPVFSLLDRGPLAETCSYLSYESVHDLADNPHLSHLSDSVLEEFTEEAEF